jgi:ATP-dependent Zn protease
MKTKRKSERKSIAYHEAGHAVIARVLGMTCSAATIVPDYEKLEGGHVLTNVERSVDDWDARGRIRHVSIFRARIMMLMAGRESEIEVFGKAPDAWFGDEDDLREIDWTMDEANVPDRAFLDKMRTKTRGLVRRHRDAIAQVAAALIKHRSLDARQIDEIVAASGARLPGSIVPGSVTSKERYRRHLAWATGKNIVFADDENAA